MNLSHHERLLRQIRGQSIDSIPTIGGWINGARNLAHLASISVEEYLSDPLRGVISANVALDVDGMVNPAVPQTIDEMRTGSVQESHFTGIEPEALQAKAESLPDNEAEVLRGFDYPAEEQRYRGYFMKAFRTWKGIAPVPNFWEIGGHFPLYTEYGYTAFLSACALYPDHVGKIWWVKSLHSRERAKILVKLYRELDLLPIMFCGEDLANNQGPMVSPVFLRKHYLPHVKMIIEPLIDSGVRLIHHCDGDIRPLLDDYLAIGFSGLQGFQYELGLEIQELRQKRSALGETLLFFTGLSVSRTLPFGTLDEIAAEIDYFVQSTDGGQGMFLFTSNVTGVEVPPESIRFAYQYARQIKPGKQSIGHTPHQKWPWGTISTAH